MHLYLSRFVCWVHYCSKLCQSSPWRKDGLFQKQLPSSKRKPFPNESDIFLFSFFFLFPLPVPFRFLVLFLLSLSLSLSLFPFLFLFFFPLLLCTFSNYTFSEKLKVEMVTQSTCWTLFTTRITSTANITSLKIAFFPGSSFLTLNFKEDIAFVWGGATHKWGPKIRPFISYNRVLCLKLPPRLGPGTTWYEIQDLGCQFPFILRQTHCQCSM